MGIRLLTGINSAKKTDRLLQEICEISMKETDRKVFLIVPEQFSLQMQTRLVELSPRHGFFHTDVLSFHRLAYRIFEDRGITPANILEDLGISMLLRRILSAHENELGCFKRSLRKAGFIDELKSILIEMISYCVSPRELAEAAENISGRPAFRRKCEELSRIYTWLMEETRGRYMITEEILHVAKDHIRDCGFLKDTEFYFDGFTGFTPVQLNFLKELLLLAPRLNITVTIPDDAAAGPGAEDELFHFSKKTVTSLMKMCRQTGREFLAEDMGFEKQEEDNALAHLCSNIFSRKKEVYKKDQDLVHVTICHNPDAEADYILHKIELLVRSRNLRYRDFAILCGDVEEYADCFERRAKILGIPLFEDSKRKLNYQAGIETIRSIFALAAGNYSYESVFRFLKSGMSDLDDEDVDFFENYVLSAGIRGHYMYKNPFVRMLMNRDEEEIARLERLREELIRETEALYQVLSSGKCQVKEVMTVLYQTLISLHMPEKLEAKAQEAEAAGDYDRGRECRQLFALIVGLMDKIVAIFPEETMTAGEIFEVIDAGLETLEVGVAPLAMDQVIFGDLKRTRLPRVRYLFIAGMNEGLIPPAISDGGIINDTEKSLLSDQGIELSAGLLEQTMEDEFYMYLAFRQPSDGLFMTSAATDSAGSMRRPSVLLAEIQKIFPALSFRKFPEEEVRYYFNEEDSMEYLTDILRRMREDPAYPEGNLAAQALLSYWMGEEEGKKKIRDFWALPGRRMEKISKEAAEALYGCNLVSSVTRLESYASCPYKYFCTYGLDLADRPEYEVTPLEMGNLLHKTMEIYCRKVKESPWRFAQVPEKEKEAFLQEALAAASESLEGGVFEDNARNRYRLMMAERIARRTLDVMAGQLRFSDFEPDRFELAFGFDSGLESNEISLDDDHSMRFLGVVDRVDVCEMDDRLMVRLIDYKSGRKKFDLNQAYHGLQIQLIVYMNAVSEIYEKEKKKIPEIAGIFYYQMQDPIQQSDHYDEKKLGKAFYLSGYANADKEIIDHLEFGEDRFVSMDVSIKKDGNLTKRSKVITEEDFRLLGDYVRKKMKSLGREIYEGKIRAWPMKEDKTSACDYCPYPDVCGFDPRQAGFLYHDLLKMDPEEVLKKMLEEE